mmetsp:Transcript_55882/g.126070  ORF Transcript_55882/g.126070 Transcript_55882/m.126070 type:complete len:432 (+) Transcript_55882:421-1716(+)
MVEFAHELLEKSRLLVQLLVLGVHKHFAFHLLLLVSREVQLHLLVDARVGVAEGMQHQVVLARPGDLEPQLLLDDTLRVADALEGHDARCWSLDQEEKPLLELGLREEWSVHRANGLTLPEVLAHHTAGDGGDVAHNDLLLVLHLDDRLQLDVADVRAERLDVEGLLGLHRGHALALLGILGEEIAEGVDRVLATVAVLQRLLGEVGDLQQLRALHVQRLHKAPPELDHGLRREEPLPHACNLDHCLRDLHGVLQQLVRVAAELWRHQVVQPLHMRPDEELVLHNDGQLKLPLLVLRHSLTDGLHLRVVCRPRVHAPALGRGREQLRAVLHTRALVDVVPQELQGLNHHAIRRVVLGPLVVANESHWHDEEENEEENAEDHELVLLLQEEARQTDAHLRGLRAVGVAVLLVVLLGRLIGQGVVRLCDLDEP